MQCISYVIQSKHALTKIGTTLGPHTYVRSSSRFDFSHEVGKKKVYPVTYFRFETFITCISQKATN